MGESEKPHVKVDDQCTVINTPESGTAKEISSPEDATAAEGTSKDAEQSEQANKDVVKASEKPKKPSPNTTKSKSSKRSKTTRKSESSDSSGKTRPSFSKSKPDLYNLDDSPDDSSEAESSQKKQKSKKKTPKSTKSRGTVNPELDSDSSDVSTSSPDTQKKRRAAKEIKRTKGKGKGKAKKEDSTDSDDSDDSSSSEHDQKIKAAAKKLKELKAKRKAKSAKSKKSQARNADADSDADSDLDHTTDTDSSDVSRGRSKAKKKGKRKVGKKSQKAIGSDGTVDVDVVSGAIAKMDALKRRVDALEEDEDTQNEGGDEDTKKKKKKKGKKMKKGAKTDFVRVDRLWSKREHRYVLKASCEEAEVGEFEEYSFNVCRRFDWQNKFEETTVSIVSNLLKNALQHVMGDVRCISLEEETPSVDPDVLFLHLKELRSYRKELKAKSKAKKSKKKAKALALEAKHLKSLTKYLDKDYEEKKKSLYPLLDSGKITFDLLWGLFKSNEIVYAETYSAREQPRAFKVDYVCLVTSILKGAYYEIEGRYLEYDGETFGMGTVSREVAKFNGPRKISSLPCYPLKYHKDYEGLRKTLIGRGKNFVSLQGMQYRHHKGMAFAKRRNQVVKYNLAGRVMIDPATFRRINANYPVSTPKADEKDILSDSEDESESSDDDEAQGKRGRQSSDDEIDDKKKKRQPKPKRKLVKDPDEEGSYMIVDIPVDEDGNIIQAENFEPLLDKDSKAKEKFTEEELLIASPTALGFSFGEKLWLEFAVSGITEIQWNDGAFDSLIIPDDQKEVVRALVESHAHQQSKNIDDVIQGKGRGLVAVLHGPPGTGKTLTAEGIAELLRKPLYAVTSGELGIRTDAVEETLTQILDVAHTWGALLLLDEADVFLEQREPHDISRNALVSIFLRMLEYFQGILFLTTNRVATFDAAFASRIHIGLRYGELSVKARKAVWKMFITKLKALPEAKVDEITEDDYTRLANFMLNGREIKNSVRTAQSMALVKSEPVSMPLLLRVLLVMNVFSNDLKGPGYEEALKFYM